jgi:adenylate cyclase
LRFWIIGCFIPAWRDDEVEYTRGKQATMQAELRAAREFFQKAIDADPEYAVAYVGLADTWLDRPVAEGGPAKGDTALRTALQVDPNLAEARLRLGQHEYLRNWHWSTAEREIKRTKA